MEDRSSRSVRSGDMQGAQPLKQGQHVRLFAAVWPPDEVVALLASFPRSELRDVRWTTPAQWHVTLAFLGDVAQSLIDSLGSALAKAMAELPGPFEVRLGPATQQLGRSVLCVPVSGLDALAAATRAAFAEVLSYNDGGHGSGNEQALFRGHLTIARARGGHRVPASLVGVPVKSSWTIEAVCLVRSELEPRGARYTTIAQATVPGH